MKRLAWRFAVQDARRAPGRVLAVAVLLGAAAWLPGLLDAPPLAGLLIAVVVAFTAAVGASGLEEPRVALLLRNGARGGQIAWLTAAQVLLPGLVAFVATGVLAVATGGGPSPTVAVLATVVIPVVVAPLAAVTARGSGRAPTPHAAGRRRWGRWVALVAACVVFPPLGLTVVAAQLVSGSWSHDRVRRLASGLLALAGLGLAVVAVGSSDTWSELALTLFFVVPVLVTAAAVLAVLVQSAVTDRVARLGPRARLALAPLVVRRRVVAPLLALATLAMTVAVTDGVVGASFGEREADRSRTLPPVTAVAGNSPDQAIVSVPPVDPVALRSLLDAELEGTGATAVVIDKVGTGGRSRVAGSGSDSVGLLDFTDAVVRRDLGMVGLVGPAASTWTGTGTEVGTVSRWVGVVAPDALDLLGWSDAAVALTEDRVVVVADEEMMGSDGNVAVVAGSKIERLPAHESTGARGGQVLPGALVSPAVATHLSPLVTTARVVLVPTPGASDHPDVGRLVELGERVRAAALRLPLVEPEGLTPEQASTFGWYASTVAAAAGGEPVVAGSERVTIWESGPLNDVPYFATTAGQARRSVLPLVAGCIVITLAVVFLALGATRRDDTVLAVQGAPGRLRSGLAAIQAGVVTGTASVVAGVLGVAVPAASFAVYNRGADLPSIPLVIPAHVWLVLVAVPVGTAAIAALLPLFGRRSTPTARRDSADLLW